ncbi:SUMO-interacting motif-containing protein 1 isoform X2 [Pyxicephalus adspersus]|uniref:SUMO-interacting motif-containing protein 1 isoform X2 n=1 Tax=Pyxicephalus adspersus TaxID=30357 RepID=UPI003B5CA210
MEDTIVISDEEEAPAGLLSESWGSGIIDLTSNHYAQRNLSELESSVIDLTANEDVLGMSPRSSLSTDGLSNSDRSEDVYSPSNSSSGVISENEGTSNCSWGTDSDTTSKENGVIGKDVSTLTKDNCLTDQAPCLPYQANLIELPDTTLNLRGWSPLLTPASGESSSDCAARFSSVSCQTPSDAGSISSVPIAEEYPAHPSPINTALFYKLRYFKKPPVSHYFHRLEKPEKNEPRRPIPLSRMSIVNNTREENIHQGTLHFLSEFVTAKHYPPKDIVMHVIQSILLGVGPEEQAIRHEAYMILMKVQKLHPATVHSVAWNWNLLSEVMERKENHTCHLFLQYVVQTLDDDFNIHMLRRNFQKSLCKTMLSCNQANIKNVIDWLIHAVENACEVDGNRDLNVHMECEQRIVFLLQRMLSIAVEVDNLPVINSNRIAELLFPYVIVLKTKQQRESRQKKFNTAKSNAGGEVSFLQHCQNLDISFQY